MKVTHIDKNGNIIDDLSKVKLPKEIQMKLIEILDGNPKERNPEPNDDKDKQ